MSTRTFTCNFTARTGNGLVYVIATYLFAMSTFLSVILTHHDPIVSNESCDLRLIDGIPVKR